MINNVNYEADENFKGELYAKVSEQAEMTERDHLFLYSLLKKYRPKKIMEIGVFRGGTDVLILDWINKNNLSETELFSVDLAEQVGNDKVGHLVYDNRNNLSNYHNYHLYTGVTVADVVEGICEDSKIDFCIIDTAHILPGEILDFLAVLPFLRKDAVVVLHDVMLHHMSKDNCYATQIVLDCVAGEKIWDWDGETYPNIAAIQINDDTYKYIDGLIGALSIPWLYNPGSKLLESYERIIRQNYSKESYLLYKKMVELSLQWIKKNKKYLIDIITLFINTIASDDRKRVFIYGTGKNAHRWITALKESNALESIYGFVISDDQERTKESIEGIKVYKWGEIGYRGDMDVIINTVADGSVEKKLKDAGVKFFINGNWERHISSKLDW